MDPLPIDPQELDAAVSKMLCSQAIILPHPHREGWGLKVFTRSAVRGGSPWWARCARARQARAAEHGLAPPTGSAFSFVHSGVHRDGMVMHGYETGMADTKPFEDEAGAYWDEIEVELGRLREAAGRVSCGGIPMNDELILMNERNEGGGRWDLESRALTHPDTHVLGGDLHKYNIGMWEGRVVMIDFGVGSTVRRVWGRRLLMWHNSEEGCCSGTSRSGHSGATEGDCGDSMPIFENTAPHTAPQ